LNAETLDGIDEAGRSMILHEQLSEAIIGAAIEVHRQLGPGLLESIYATCLEHELSLRGISSRREVALPINYKGIAFEAGYRIDLLVENTVIVEVKAIETVLPVHEAQLLTYLKLSQKRVGLLINFNVPLLKDGITRRVL
jgi:GxxExxY protein